jgi:hypothetical protein
MNYERRKALINAFFLLLMSNFCLFIFRHKCRHYFDLCKKGVKNPLARICNPCV